MSKLVLDNETGLPVTPGVGKTNLYFNPSGQIAYMGNDGVEHAIDSAVDVLADHVAETDPHSQYMTVAEANALYAEISHSHPRNQLIIVTGNPGPGEYSSIAAAISAASAMTPTTTNRIVIQVLPGEYTEAPFTIPAFVYLIGTDPWNSAHIKTNDNSSDFIRITPNGGMFSLSVTGPTDPGFSCVYQDQSGVTKMYWINLRNGYYGVSIKNTTGTARTHCIGVVTDSITNMNRMFNCDNPSGVGIFILMQCGSMSGSGLSYSVYLNGSLAFATLDLCMFRISGATSVYVDGGATVKGISTTFAGGLRAIHVGPNGASKCEVHGSVIKQGLYTDDIKIESASAVVSFSGSATKSKITSVAGAHFSASFSDSTLVGGGHNIIGELYIGDLNVQTPLASYIQADKNTGVVSGGGLSRGTGSREVDVGAGDAFIDTATGLKHITWIAETITLAANEISLYVYIDGTGVIQQSTTEPDLELNVLLGEAGTSATNVIYLFDQKILLPQFRPAFYEYLENVIGPINDSGGIVTAAGLGITVASSTYFLTERPVFTAASSNPANLHIWWRNGSGGWDHMHDMSAIDPDVWDDGTGTLAAVPTGKWTMPAVYVAVNSGSTDFHVIVGQEVFDTELEALTMPVPPDFIGTHACRLAGLMVQEGATAISSISDQRPKLGQFSSGSTAVTNHGGLEGLDQDHHPQYQLRSEKGNANGYASLDAGGIVPTTQLPSLPHGDLGGGTLHSVATTSTAGFMSGSDKTKLDSVTVANIPSSTEKQALAGTAGTPATGNKYVTDQDTRMTNARDPIPQGSSTQVQYNNSGTQDGASKVVIDSDEALVLLPFLGSDSAAVPASGGKLITRDETGRTQLEMIDKSGIRHEMHSAFNSKNQGFWKPQGNSTTVQTLGMPVGTDTGSPTARNVATTSLLASMRRIGYVNANNAGNLAGIREAVAQLFCGNVAGIGGFFVSITFGIAVVQTGARWFVGLDNNTAAPTNVEPTGINNTIAFGKIAGSDNVHAWGRAAGAITPVDLGTNFPANTANAVYEARFFCLPNSSVVAMSLRRLDADFYYENLDVGSTMAVPAANTLLGIKAWITNNATTGQLAIDIASIYKETEN